jgi:molybdopterin adenylyltransferase
LFQGWKTTPPFFESNQQTSQKQEIDGTYADGSGSGSAKTAESDVGDGPFPESFPYGNIPGRPVPSTVPWKNRAISVAEPPQDPAVSDANSSNSSQTKARIGVVTVSDRASRGEYEDRGGPAIQDYLLAVLESDWEPVVRVVPDEPDLVKAALIELCDQEQCCLVVTTGGTGPAKRDITPEATTAVAEKMMPGFGELMRQVSLQFVPTAILSRQTAAIRGQSLIVNLPGQPKAIAECLDAVFPAIPYCIDLIEGPFLVTNESRFKTFRPKKK